MGSKPLRLVKSLQYLPANHLKLPGNGWDAYIVHIGKTYCRLNPDVPPLDVWFAAQSDYKPINPTYPLRARTLVGAQEIARAYLKKFNAYTGEFWSVAASHTRIPVWTYNGADYSEIHFWKKSIYQVRDNADSAYGDGWKYAK